MFGGTSCTPDPAISPGTAQQQRSANQHPSCKPMAATSCLLFGVQAAPSTASPIPPKRCQTRAPREASPKRRLSIPNLPWASLHCSEHPLCTLAHPPAAPSSVPVPAAPIPIAVPVPHQQDAGDEIWAPDFSRSQLFFCVAQNTHKSGFYLTLLHLLILGLLQPKGIANKGDVSICPSGIRKRNRNLK